MKEPSSTRRARDGVSVGRLCNMSYLTCVWILTRVLVEAVGELGGRVGGELRGGHGARL